MERSLSVLMPVRNAQSTLALSVFELLEVLPELTSRFELILIDDGSTDATVEVADDLAAQYPQIRAVRHAEPLGRTGTVRTGLRHSSGDVIFLREEGSALPLHEIRRLWHAVDQHPLVIGRAGPRRRYSRWIGWKRRGSEESFRMVDRQAIHELQRSLEEQVALVESLVQQADEWHEVEIPRRRTPRPSGLASFARQQRQRRIGKNNPGSPPSSNEGREEVSRPKYLRRLKDFALGE